MMRYIRRIALISLLFVTGCSAGLPGWVRTYLQVPRAQHLTIQVKTKLPHDINAFTEGLIYDNGVLLESFGEYDKSGLQVIDLKTGQATRRAVLPERYFGEGLALVGSRLIQLTWQEHTAFLYDRASFVQNGTWTYDGEGWGLCHDGTHFYMSNGSAFLTVRDTASFAALKQIPVLLDGQPIDQLNELECVGDSVYANVWHTNNILQIDKVTGRVSAVIDASGLLTAAETLAAGQEGVLNGIAYDPQHKTFWITGKLWPWLFEVTWVPAAK